MPKSFLIPKRPKIRKKKEVDGVLMYKCRHCGKWRFEDDFYVYKNCRGKHIHKNGHQMSICKKCYIRKKRTQREWAKKNKPSFQRYLQLISQYKQFRRDNNLTFEQFEKIRHKIVFVTPIERTMIFERVVKNIQDKINLYKEPKHKIAFVKLIGIDPVKNQLKFYNFLNDLCSKVSSSLNLKNYGVMWYVDYDNIEGMSQKTRQDKINLFNYKNLVCKKINNLY